MSGRFPIFHPSVQETAQLLQSLLDLKEGQANNNDDNNRRLLPPELDRLVSGFLDAQEEFTNGIKKFMCRRKWEKDELDSTKVIAETWPKMLEVPCRVHINGDSCNVLPIKIITTYQVNNDVRVHFVPLLAKIGLKNGVGGRGGLFLNPQRNNAGLRRPIADIIRYDDIQTIKALIHEQLFFKDDVCAYKLLHYAVAFESLRCMKFLVKLDRSSLLCKKEQYIPLHGHCINRGTTDLSMSTAKYLLQKTLQYFPTHETIGGLFSLDGRRKNTTLKRMIEKYGAKATWDLIEESLSPYKEVPILHKVIKHVPDQILNAIERFPASIFLRDSENRLPIHVALGAGLKWSHGLLHILNANISHLKDKDPVSGFYPFALAAAKPCCDLKTIIYLLKLHPAHGRDSIVRRGSSYNNDDTTERERKRRKIDG